MGEQSGGEREDSGGRREERGDEEEFMTSEKKGCAVLSVPVAAGRGSEGACAPGGSVQGRHFEGRKYEIMKFAGFWQIGVCTA